MYTEVMTVCSLVANKIKIAYKGIILLFSGAIFYLFFLSTLYNFCIMIYLLRPHRSMKAVLMLLEVGVCAMTILDRERLKCLKCRRNLPLQRDR